MEISSWSYLGDHAGIYRNLVSITADFRPVLTVKKLPEDRMAVP